HREADVGERRTEKGRLTSKQPWGVVLVDPLPVVREGIARLISDQPNLDVLAQASDGQDAFIALGGVRKTRVVVLVSLALEEPSDAHWLIREIRDRYPSHAVLAVGANADATAISRV